MDITLHLLVPRSHTGVGHRRRDHQLPARRQFRLVECRRGNRKGGVAETEPERDQRGRGRVEIARADCVRIVREVVRVVGRHLPDGARPCHRDLAPGIDVAEQRARHCRPAARTGVPGLEDRGHLVVHAREVERATVEQHHHHRLARRQHGVEQFALLAGQREVGTRRLLGTHVELLADRHHDEVGSCRQIDRLLHFGRRLICSPARSGAD